MISEQDFKIVLDAMWRTYTKAADLIDVLNSIDLHIDNTSHNTAGTTGFNELITIQNSIAPTILKLMGLKDNEPGSNERQTMKDEINQFLRDVRMKNPVCLDSDGFPETYYEKLLKILIVSGGIKLSWK